MGGSTKNPGRRALGPYAAPLAVAVAAGLVFVIVLVQVLTVGPILWGDHALQASVAVQRDPLGVRLAGAISRATAFPAEVVAGLLLALLLVVRTRAPMPLRLAVLGMLALLAVPAIKELVSRPRPPANVRPVLADDLVTDLANDAAFPSGHAATSALFAGLVYLLIAPHLAGLGRRLLGVAAVAYAVVVGASRVYLGVHWLTDVIAGWALGVVIVAGLVLLTRRHRNRRTREGGRPR